MNEKEIFDKRNYLIGENIKEATMLAKLQPPSRDASMVLTKLDEARLWLGQVTYKEP